MHLFLVKYYFLYERTVIETLLLHGNNFIGTWPDSYCSTCNTTDCSEMNADGPFREFSLNCLQTPCTVGCCDGFNNCFND